MSSIVAVMNSQHIVDLDEHFVAMVNHDVLRASFEIRASTSAKKQLSASDIVFTSRFMEMSSRFKRADKKGAERLSQLVRLLVFVDDRLSDMLNSNMPFGYKFALQVDTLIKHTLDDLTHGDMFRGVEDKHRQMLIDLCAKVHATICKHAYA